MLTKERRQYPRFPFHSRSELRLDFMAYRGKLIDISLFGALFEAQLFQLNFAPCEKCTLEILHLNDDAQFSVEGVIVHTRMNLVGIQFAPVNAERQAILQRIGMLNLAPPNLLNRRLPAPLQPWAK